MSTSSRDFAKGLGWFSIALGLTEVFAPRQLGAFLGMEDKEGLLRAFGLREIGAGLAILAMPEPAPAVWGRVAGDLMDLAALGSAAGKDNPKRQRVNIAIALIAGITLIDALAARAAQD